MGARLHVMLSPDHPASPEELESLKEVARLIEKKLGPAILKARPTHFKAAKLIPGEDFPDDEKPRLHNLRGHGGRVVHALAATALLDLRIRKERTLTCTTKYYLVASYEPMH